jgi:hypothetical protein
VSRSLRYVAGQGCTTTGPRRLTADEVALINEGHRRVVRFTCDRCGRTEHALTMPYYSEGVTFESLAFRGPCYRGRLGPPPAMSVPRGECPGYGTWRVVLRTL